MWKHCTRFNINQEFDMPLGTTVYAAFCGTGKTYYCANNDNATEVECYKYSLDKFPTNYVSDILVALKQYDIVFISTNPVVLHALALLHIEVILIYPDACLNNTKMRVQCVVYHQKVTVKLLGSNI